MHGFDFVSDEIKKDIARIYSYALEEISDFGSSDKTTFTVGERAMIRIARKALKEAMDVYEKNKNSEAP